LVKAYGLILLSPKSLFTPLDFGRREFSFVPTEKSSGSPATPDIIQLPQDKIALTLLHFAGTAGTQSNDPITHKSLHFGTFVKFYHKEGGLSTAFPFEGGRGEAPLFYISTTFVKLGRRF